MLIVLGRAVLQLTLLCCTSPLYSQYAGFKNYSVKDGLPSGVVYDCLQDKEGFMWFATQAGLARFDGFQFRVFTTEDGLTNNEIVQLGLDADGSIWIFPFGTSPCIYDPLTKKILNQYNYAELAKLDNKRFQIQIRRSEFGLIGLDGYHSFIFLENKKIIHLQNSSGRQDLWLINNLKESIQIQRLPDGRVQLTDGKKDFVFDTSIFYSGLTFSATCDWSTGKVFVNSSSRNLALVSYIPHKGISLAKVFHSPHSVKAISKWQQHIYITTTNGLYVTDTTLTRPALIMSGYGIGRVFADREGNEWICTVSGRGIFVRQHTPVVQHDWPAGMPFENITTVMADRSKKIICGDAIGNVYLYNSQTLPVILNSCLEKVREIHSSHKGLVYYSDKRLFVDNRLLRIIKQDKKVYGESIKSVVWYNQDTLLIGSHFSLSGYDMATGILMLYHKGERFGCLLNSMGRLYFANFDGVFKITSLKPFRKELLGGSAKPVNHLAATKDGLIWVATNNEGLLVLRNEKILTRIHTKSVQPLTSDICKKVISDEKNQSVWVVTNKGINRIIYKLSGDSIHTNISAITSAEGLSDDDVNDLCILDGKVYAATIKGLNIFNVDLPERSIPILFTDIRARNTKGIIEQLDARQAPTLHYNQNNISITYASICYACNTKLAYQYRLLTNTVDTTWKTTPATTVEFGELTPGAYHFQVRTDEANMHAFSFIIQPAFWQTSWFVIFCITVAAMATFLFIKYSIDRIRKRELEKTTINQKFAELEFQALQAQMNPHFVFNAMNTLQNYILKQESEKASDYLAKFSRLMRLFLDSSRQKYLTLTTEIDLLRNYIELEQARLEHSFTYELVVSEDIDQDDVKIPSAIVQPFVENAILHGLRHRKDEQGKLSVRFSLLSDEVLHCQIEDNGIGRRASVLLNQQPNRYQSQGIRIIEEKLKTLNVITHNEITIETKDVISAGDKAMGTLVSIRFHQKQA